MNGKMATAVSLLGDVVRLLGEEYNNNPSAQDKITVKGFKQQVVEVRNEIDKFGHLDPYRHERHTIPVFQTSLS